MKKLKLLTLTLLLSASLQATTIYYNGEDDDIGEWTIQPGSTSNAQLREVHDNTLNSTVMQFSDGGVYRLRLPNSFWANSTEKVLSFDMRLNSYYTIYIYVDTLDGVRKLFYNALNVHVGHHNTGILNAIGNGRTHMFERSGWREPRGVPAFNRNGWVRATLDLDRELTDTEPNNRVVRVLSMRIGGTAGRIDNVTLDNPTRTTYAQSANDWHITTGIPEGGTIENHQENQDRGNVIAFSGTNESNSYTSGRRTNLDAGSWNDTTHDTIQWKMRTDLNYRFVVHTTTANGQRDLVYLSSRSDRALNPNTNEIAIGIGWARNGDGVAYGQGTDGRWQTMTRNVAMDIAEFDNGNTLTSINGVTVVGINGREITNAMTASDIFVDDIQLFKSVEPTAPTIHEEATNLHQWRLRMNSVKISFIDNANGEIGFKFINADTNEELGNNLPPVDGTGTSTIGQINGLTPNTTYNIRVETLFDDGRDTAVSEPITITTLEDPNAGNPNAQVATDLHRWSLRSDSVRISFKDNSNSETGFRFINADTNVQLGDNLNASAGIGVSLIGQINALTPNTTYNILVQTLLNNGETVDSEPITITTLAP